jgi:hypothetical protein
MVTKKRYSNRLVAYVNLWRGVDDRERDELLKQYSKLIASSKLNARIYEYGRDGDGAAIIAVRFNGSDIDRVANCLDITASDLLSRDVGLAMGDE